jgi:vacuolar protein-sorting-associated protein 4
VKESIRKKIQEYLDRAEKLKEVVAKPQKKKAITSDTSGTGSAGK